MNFYRLPPSTMNFYCLPPSPIYKHNVCISIFLSLFQINMRSMHDAFARTARVFVLLGTLGMRERRLSLCVIAFQAP